MAILGLGLVHKPNPPFSDHQFLHCFPAQLNDIVVLSMRARIILAAFVFAKNWSF
jgi:hypothetical protein